MKPYIAADHPPSTESLEAMIRARLDAAARGELSGKSIDEIAAEVLANQAPKSEPA